MFNLAKRTLLLPGVIVLFSILVLALFYKLVSIPFLTFSDGAKYADIARNILNGSGYGINFYFFPLGDLDIFSGNLFPAPQIAPLMPFSIALSFVLLGISDFAVVATSSFYFILLTVFVYLLGQKVFGRLVGFLAAIAVMFDPSLINYANSGASEPLFAFEIVLGAYLFILKKKWTDFLGFITLAMLYFTRPQAFIYIAGLIFLWLLLRFPIKKVVLYFTVIVLSGILFDVFALKPLSGKFFLYSILGTSQHVLEYVPGSSSSELLRGVTQQAPLASIFKKVFYNLYNFFKLMPQILSPYLWTLFIIGLFRRGKDRVENSFKSAVIFMVLVTFLVTALSIPLFRYLHPAVPFVYLFSVAALVWIVEIMFKKQQQLIFVSSLLISLFVVGQTLGVIFLDSRFEAKRVNKGKPPAYIQLSRILKDNTRSEDIIVTNLDAWGSWYGERKTIWYPLKPIQLTGMEDNVDAIYLTNYLIDDENYYMGEEWRQIFENPKSPKDEFIRKNYQFQGEFIVAEEDTYEKVGGRGILLVRK